VINLFIFEVNRVLHRSPVIVLTVELMT